MSPRRKVLQFVGILAALAMLGALVAGPASAKRMTAKQKAHVRAELRKQVKKNPKVVQKKSFLKKASLVNFTLPVTIRLRGASGPLADAYNPNKATIDLGASLGQREINLGGSLAAEIKFHDSFDGGALGNVDLALLPSTKTTRQLTSTSIPLLWNTQVSDPTTYSDGNNVQAALIQAGYTPAAAAAARPSGCGNFTSTNPDLVAGHLPFGKPVLNAGAGYPGFPFNDPNPASIPYGGLGGFLPIRPGNDAIDKLTAARTPGDNNKLGGNVNPFPYTSESNPYGFVQPPSVKDTVLRTNALSLGIATPGTEVNQSTGTSDHVGTDTGPEGSQNSVIGQSGGQANLFGNIPGKGVGIDVTVSLATKINSLIRITDQDTFGAITTGDKWPAGIFGCRQIWTGAVQNYIPGVHLTGSLKISPGITADGKLRIAKASIKTPNIGTKTEEKARVALAACLAPYEGFDADQGTTVSGPYPSVGSTSLVPGIASGFGANPSTGLVADNDPSLPSDPTATSNPAPQGVPCNAPPTAIVRDSAKVGTVQQLSGASNITDGYTTSSDGSKVSVAGDLRVDNVDVDVLIGDTTP